MKGIMKKTKAYLSALLCIIMCVTGILGFTPVDVSAAETGAAGDIHVYADTPGDVESSKYTLTANGTEVPVIKYQANGNNFDIARFASDDRTPEYTVTVTEEINTVTVYPERYYPQDGIMVSADKHSVTFELSDKLPYCFVMINGGPADQAGKPYLAIINDPMENAEDIPDPDAKNVLNFQTFMETYLEEHPNSEAQKAEPAGTTSGGVAYEAGELVANGASQVRFPNKRQMTEDDATYALQAALDEIYKEGSPYDTLYFPAGTYTYSGLEIRNRNGKDVTIYVEEGALLKNRLQECMQAMEPAIGIWDSSDITISGRGIFDGNGVENYRKDRHDAKDSCHQGGVMIVRSSNITFNDTYVRDAKQWNWESHGSKNCTLNNIKGLTPYNQPWVDGLDMASAQDLTINGALTLGNDDNFASGHYNPSDGFPSTVPGFDQYNSDALEWDTEDSFNVSVNNTLGWSYNGGNGVRMGHNTYGHQMKNYTFTNVNTTNFTGGGRGITVQNNTGTYPRYESIVFKDCSFDTTRVGRNFQIMGKNPLIDTVTLDNCWFSNGNAVSEAANIENLTIKDLYIGGKKVEVSNFANLTTNNITNFSFDWINNHAPEFTAPEQAAYEGKAGQKLEFAVTASDADESDTVTLSADGLPEGAKFEKGTFTWTPSDEQLGNHEVTFTATDSRNVKATKKVSFTIKDKVGNTAPEFSEFEGAPYSVKAGETLKFKVSASDAENDTVTLSVVGELPRGAEFDAVEGILTWKTSASQVGSKEITFAAEDQWGAVSQASVTVTVEAGVYNVVDIPASEDTYLASWKDEKKLNFEGNDYLRVRRMSESITDSNTCGLWGEKVTDTSDAKDAKISVLKFDAAELKKNLDNLEKAELELTLINRRDSSSIGTDRLMAAAVTGDWTASELTWLAHPDWTADVKYSDEFSVDTNPAGGNKDGITVSRYDGTKAVVDVTDFVKNLKNTDTVLFIAVCDEKGYELAFASTEGAAKLDAEKAAAPVLRLTVKKQVGPEKEVGKVPVSEDSFVGSWSGDQTKNFGSLSFLRVAYGSDSKGVLGTGSGGDNKVTYLKFDLSSLNADEFDRAKLQLTVLGVRKDAAKNQETGILVGVADNTEWTEGGLTWQNKPQVTTGEDGLVLSEAFRLGSVVNNDPAKITGAPDGAVATADITEFVLQALGDGKDTLTLAVNLDDSNAAMTQADANRIFFISKEGAGTYTGSADMAPALVLTKYASEDEPAYKSFTPNSQWLDTDGNMIQAHGGGIIWDEKTQKYYWYGENKGEDGFSAAIGVSCYSSTDLYNWDYEGMALPVFNNPAFLGEGYTDNTPLYLAESSEEYQAAKEAGAAVSKYDTLEKYNSAEEISALNELYEGMNAADRKALYDKLNWNGVVERPKVIYNDQTKKYVMWFHKDGEGTGTYKLAQTGIAVSDSPTGPFKLVDCINPNDSESRDMTLFKDDNGKAYLLYSSEDNWTLHIAELNDEYTGLTGNYSRNYVYKSGSKGVFAREAPAIFKYDGKYYLISSGCTGWRPNEMGYSVAEDIAEGMSEDGGNGPFQFENNQALPTPCIGADAATSFGGQSTFVLPVQGKEGCFIYMGDKWNSGNLKDSRYQWLPIQIDGEKELTLSWADSWTLDDFANLNSTERAALNRAVKEGKALNAADYRSETKWNALQDLLTEASALSYDASKDEITALTTGIQGAIASLNKWKTLDDAMYEVETRVDAEYTPETWKAVQDAYDASKALADDASDEKIQAAADAITDALAKLVKENVETESFDLTDKKIAADSEQASANNQAEKAIDRDESTFWHSAWGTGATELPHHLTIDLGESVDNLYELLYLPRQDKGSNGIITKYRILVSNADKELAELTDDDFTEVRIGKWADDKKEKSAVFRTEGAVRYLRLEAVEGHGGYASAAEIKLNVRKSEPAVLTGVEVKTNPSKTEYKLGEDLDLAGLVLTAQYSDGTSADITDTKDLTVAGFDTAKPGAQTIKVTYQDKTAEFSVNMTDQIADGLELKELQLTAPNKVQYQVGEELDTEGMKVTAVYDKGVTKDVTDDVEISGFTSAKAADEMTVTVSYGEKTAQFAVQIHENAVEPELSRIDLAVPEKTVYYVGEDLDLAGMKVTAVYSNGRTVEISNDDPELKVSGFDSSKANEALEITVAYQGKTAVFTVEIKEKEEPPVPEKKLQGIRIDANPDKTEYQIGDALDLAGMKVTAVYDDESSEDVTALVQVTGYDSSEAGEVTVSVSYEGFTQTFTVTVREKAGEDQPGNDLGNDPADDPTDDPGSNPGTNSGDNTDNNVNVDKNDRPGSDQTANGDKAAQSGQTSNAVKTGDSSHAAGYAVILALAAFAAVICVRKKLNYKKR